MPESLFHFTYFEVLVLKSSVWLLEESSRAFEQHFLEAFLMTFPPGSFHNRENHAVQHDFFWKKKMNN